MQLFSLPKLFTSPDIGEIKFQTSNIEVGKTRELVQDSKNSIESQSLKNIQNVVGEPVTQAYNLPICNAHNPSFYVTNI
ncbi:25305_t:CDS:2 [Dentiscutata erythropus]|uniref:25305_t:CDS:1 n=1 Tax=Dentiscutata erythropus TaxID=1348616 RepID=A0A9N9AVH5_9GLOM|nr:25305_t:CDS:2 [Dentiscutata erythropus]